MAGKSSHMFDPEIAAETGVNAAAVYQHVKWLIERNDKRGQCVRDGVVWAFRSAAQVARALPYLSERQSRTALRKLVETGLLVTGDYSKKSCCKAKWYALPEGTNAASEEQRGNPIDVTAKSLTTLAGLHSLMEWSETALSERPEFRRWRRLMLAGPDVFVML